MRELYNINLSPIVSYYLPRESFRMIDANDFATLKHIASTLMLESRGGWLVETQLYESDGAPTVDFKPGTVAESDSQAALEYAWNVLDLLVQITQGTTEKPLLTTVEVSLPLAQLALARRRRIQELVRLRTTWSVAKEFNTLIRVKVSDGPFDINTRVGRYLPANTKALDRLIAGCQGTAIEISLAICPKGLGSTRQLRANPWIDNADSIEPKMDSILSSEDMYFEYASDTYEDIPRRLGPLAAPTVDLDLLKEKRLVGRHGNA